MSLPHWELSVLSRAVGYPNLSSAAGSIGISQPQLSRIVQRLEAELGMPLLDRASRRKSGWTPAAIRLAELYARNSTALEKEITSLAGQSEPTHLKVATLEGLASIASAFCHALFAEAGIRLIELDVHDLHEIEELFFKGTLDLIFVSREPGRKKPRYSRLLGHQSLEKIDTDSSMHVVSAFEYQAHKDTAGHVIDSTRAEHVLVSNSLVVRRRWLESFGGTGVIPSPVRARGHESAGRGTAAHLIGSDLLSPHLWEKISSLRIEA